VSVADEGPLDVTVRLMRDDEFESVCELSTRAFGSDERIRTLLVDLRSSWAWRDELSFVAELDGQLAGHVLFTSAFVDCPERLVDVLVLSPVAVRTDVQRRGIGAAMIRTALQTLNDRAEPLVFLEGHPSYYPKFGFRSASRLGFTPPSVRIPDAAFMVHPLPRYEPWMTGALVYPDAFWRNDAVGLRSAR
jgi:putative acetyltransferase